MKAAMIRIGFGGGCFWCTEAVFMSVKGVSSVRQGWIAPADDPENYAEAVIVDFDPEEIPLSMLIDIHLQTHSSASRHALRPKYRSAVYVFSAADEHGARRALAELQEARPAVITEVLFFHDFRENEEKYLNYYGKNPEAPFCRRYIRPKLSLLNERFPSVAAGTKTQN